MKTIKKIILFFSLSVLLIIYAYVANITLLPDHMVLMEGESLSLFTLWGVKVSAMKEGDTQPAATLLSKSKVEQTGKMDLEVRLGEIDLSKSVSVNVIPKTKVIPLGNAIGLKLYTSGVLVVGMSEIEGKKPYENTGIEMGDRIVKIDEKEITSTADLIQTVNQSQGKELSIEYVKTDDSGKTEEENAKISPAKTNQNEYRLGLWVRDAAAGIGTATFYDPSTGNFASLGHGITDVDTGDLITIGKGELVTANILTVTKGEKGTPGEIRGSIETGKVLGNVSQNTSFGIFGKMTNRNAFSSYESMDVMSREEVKTGKAQIICEVETGKRKYYDIEIKKVYKNNQKDNKSMLIQVTDPELLKKTGGIIQGMSGSPIIQDGKFVGAVTHVLVNDPTTGYGVFADMMLKTMQST